MKPYVVTYTKWSWDFVKDEAVVRSVEKRTFWRERDAVEFTLLMVERAKEEAFECEQVSVGFRHRYQKDFTAEVVVKYSLDERGRYWADRYAQWDSEEDEG